MTRPLSLLHNKPTIPFNMASIIAQASLPASTSSLYSLPNWTRLGAPGDAAQNDDGAAAGAAESTDANNNNSTTPINNSSSDLEPAYSTPESASIAYQAGLLKSDFNISGSNPSIRLAFRYLYKDERIGKSDNDSDNGGEGEELCLCWVRQDGIPCQFRPMKPINGSININGTDTFNAVALADANNNGEVEHGNLRGTTGAAEIIEGNGDNDTTNTTTMLVNENDMVLTSFPGHAFVFCRRVFDYNHHNVTDNAHQDQSEEDPIVVNEDGKTYFLRRRSKQSNSNSSKCGCKEEEDDKEESKKGGTEEEDDDEKEDEWEAYLMVGGFRPGPMPEMSDSEDENERDEDGNTGGDNEGEEEGKAEESDDESEDDDGRELCVQLVTILSIRNAKQATTKINASNSQETEEDDNDDTLPSKLMGCSECTQSVPFLRGAINPKPRHTPAFVATKSSDNGEGSALELPSRSIDSGETTVGGECTTLQVTVCTTQLDPTPLDTSTKYYDEVLLGGWPCRTEPGCFPSDMDVPENGRNLLRSRYEADILAASDSLPPEARERLKESTLIWINKSQSFGPKAAPIKGRDGCFHPGAKWLVRNGMSPAKCGGVEWFDAKHYLSDCDMWGQGGVMLHELSHAWHCLHCEDGYQNEDIKDVYQQAMDDGLYECVRVHGPQGPQCKAYACQDQMEYFAELSVAFLGGLDEREHNKWYPFNRAQLREHDPRAFAMLCRMWGVEDDSLSGGQSTAQEGGSGEGSKES